MTIGRLRGLLLWEYGGLYFRTKRWSVSCSVVRPHWWQVGWDKFPHMLELFLGPLAIIVWWA